MITEGFNVKQDLELEDFVDIMIKKNLRDSAKAVKLNNVCSDNRCNI